VRWPHLLPLAVLLAFPASAAAQGDVTVTLTPPTPGKHSRLSLHASGSAVSSGQQTPKSVSLFIARGFKLDPRARHGRCTAEQARSFNCPVDSRVATGRAQGEVTLPPFPAFPFSAFVEAFLSPKAQPGDIAGVVVEGRESKTGRQAVIHGRLLPLPGGGQFGAELRFDDFDLGQQQAPPGASAKLTNLDLSVEARRRVRTVRVVKRRVHTRHGTKVRRRRKVRIRRYYLITNPTTCTGSWPYQLRATFPTDPEVVRDGSVPCG
jgi:hypothetical protein